MRENRRKIIFAINDFTVGGAQHQLLRQFPHYDQNKFKIYLLLLMHDPVKSNLLKHIPSYITVQKFDFKGFTDVSNWLKLFSYLMETKPDLVVSSLFFANTVVRLLKLILWFPVVSREHNTYVDKKRWQIIADYLLSLVTKKMVAVSEEVADFASRQAHIPRSKFEVIENGIDLATIDQLRKSSDLQELRMRLGLEDKNLVFLHVGRLIEQKNQTLLIEGFSEYAHNYIEARLVIVGDGSMKIKLEELAEELEVKDKIIFTGEQVIVNPYYQIANVFISTSRREGMSNTHLEAAANGLPIITTETGGTSSIIRPDYNGVLILEETSRGVYAAMVRASELGIKFLSDNMWNGRERFDITNTVHSYEKLFTECVR